MFAVAELANTMKITRNFNLFSEDLEEPHPLHFASPLTMNSKQGNYFERASIGNIANFNG